MASHNDVTGDSLVSRSNTDAYRKNWESIFGKKKKNGETVSENDSQDDGEKDSE